jgi:hypothetical protein
VALGILAIAAACAVFLALALALSRFWPGACVPTPAPSPCWSASRARARRRQAANVPHSLNVVATALAEMRAALKKSDPTTPPGWWRSLPAL